MSLQKDSFSKPHSTRLHLEDEKELNKLCSREGILPGVKIREIVQDWLRIQRLRKLTEERLGVSASGLEESCEQQQTVAPRQGPLGSAGDIWTALSLLEGVCSELNAQRALLSETFTCVWSALDLITRYVVEPYLYDSSKTRADIETESSEELRDLRREASDLINKLLPTSNGRQARGPHLPSENCLGADM